VQSPEPTPAPILIAGPTAVGKSEISLLLAERIGGEIISVDSMQVYRGLDIGTAKPSNAQRARVPHHLIDVLELDGKFDAAQFADRAAQAVREIQLRGRVPILCGGTGLYFKAFLEGLGTAPPSDAALRAQLSATPLPELLRELAERDPAAYQAIDRQNPRRVIRAVEVLRLTGKPFSQQRAGWRRATDFHGQRSTSDPRLPGWEKRGEARSTRFFGLRRSNSDLRQRIEARVNAMFQSGLVAETRQLLDRGLAGNPTAMQALGYRQVIEHLHGERPLPETIELVKLRTRQFAKRQMTWFRRQMELNWVEIGSAESPAQVAGAVITMIESSPA
jgi:tRNA dimethylallyltransferase